MTSKSQALSASFEGRNLHLVISALTEIQPLFLRYSVGKSPEFYTGGYFPSSGSSALGHE